MTIGTLEKIGAVYGAAEVTVKGSKKNQVNTRYQ